MVARVTEIAAEPSTQTAPNVATHVPKNSSITTALGSSPQNFSITLLVHTPINNELIINNTVATNKPVGDKTK